METQGNNEKQSINFLTSIDKITAYFACLCDVTIMTLEFMRLFDGVQ